MIAGACEPADDSGSVDLFVRPAAEWPAAPTQDAPLPLRLPILAVMLVTIEDASYEVFQAAAAEKDLSEGDWIRVGRAAVDLVGAATLITVSGTGPEDADWVESPRWRQLSADMQTASMAVGAAANKHDRTVLTESTARLAQSCQSCHLEFSSHLVTSPDEPALLRTAPGDFPE